MESLLKDTILPLVYFIIYIIIIKTYPILPLIVLTLFSQ